MALRIGIDFDNTIVDYTGVFYDIALHLGWIPSVVKETKNAVKEYFINNNNEDRWTELQGIVYGKEINRAKLYATSMQVINDFVDIGADVFIISHKTKHPVIGDKVSLHKAALNWLKKNNIIDQQPELIRIENVFFNETLDEKVNKIAALQCDYFIDDLPSVFQHSKFPSITKKILFSPNSTNTIRNQSIFDYKVNNWMQIGNVIGVK